MEDNTVLIDLTLDPVTQQFETSNLVQISTLKQFETLVDGLKDSFRRYQEDEPDKRHNFGMPSQRASNCILVYGSRGSGKTSFIWSAVKQSLNKKCDENGTDIRSLGFIDPTLIHKHEHILLHIVARLQDITFPKKCSEQLEQNQESSREQWGETLNKMAKGLQGLSNGPRPDWLDSELLLDDQLRGGGGDLELENNFKELLNISAKILGCQMFLLVLDDLDTNFNKGEEVLETLRRYLTSSRLIVVASGDMQLFSHIARKMPISHFGEKLYKYDQNRNKERAEMVDHIEQQYLLKVFPSQRRLAVLSIQSLIERGQKFEVTTKRAKNKKSTERSLPTHIHQIFKMAFSLSRAGDIELFQSFFLRQPLRLILQQLRAYEQSTPKNSRQNWLLSLTQSYANDLYKFNIAPDRLVSGDWGLISERVFDLTRQDHDLATGFYLRPDSAQLDVNQAKLALSAAVATHAFKNAGHCLEYLFLGPAPCSLFLNQGSLDAIAFKGYLGLGHNISALRLIRHLPGVFKLKSSKQLGIYPGYFQVLRSNLGNRTDPWLAALRSRYPGEDQLKSPQKLEQVAPTEQALPVFAIKLISTKLRGQSGLLDFVSPLNLIAAVGQLLIRPPGINPDELDSMDHLFECLLNLNMDSVYNYHTRDFGGNNDEEGKGSENTEEDSTHDSPGVKFDYESLSGSLKSWFDEVRSNRANVKPSGLLLGRIWNRIWGAIQKIDANAIASENRFLGQYFERQLTCILNAFLTEELLEYDGPSLFNALDPYKSSELFYKKLTFMSERLRRRKSIQKTPWEVVPLTMTLLNCPLVRFFLSKDAIHPETRDFSNQNSDGDGIKLLDRVPIAGWQANVVLSPKVVMNPEVKKVGNQIDASLKKAPIKAGSMKGQITSIVKVLNTILLGEKKPKDLQHRLNSIKKWPNKVSGWENEAEILVLLGKFIKLVEAQLNNLPK